MKKTGRFRMKYADSCKSIEGRNKPPTIYASIKAGDEKNKPNCCPEDKIMQNKTLTAQQSTYKRQVYTIPHLKNISLDFFTSLWYEYTFFS